MFYMHAIIRSNYVTKVVRRTTTFSVKYNFIIMSMKIGKHLFLKITLFFSLGVYKFVDVLFFKVGV